MNKDTNQSDAWQPCPPGLLVRAVRLPQRRRRHQAINRALAAGVALLLAAWGGIYMSTRFGQEREFNFGGIACSDVRKLMPDYMARTLPPETAKQVGEHLDQCPHCGMLMKQMRNAMPAAISRVPTLDNAADGGRRETSNSAGPLSRQSAVAMLLANLAGN